MRKIPVQKCPNGKWRIGGGMCMYHNRAAAERAYHAYLMRKHKK